MTIQVELIDGCCVRVVPRGLDLLIERNLVRGFMRSSGWVEVGVDQLRVSTYALDYYGTDRRCRTF